MRIVRDAFAARFGCDDGTGRTERAPENAATPRGFAGRLAGLIGPRPARQAGASAQAGDSREFNRRTILTASLGALTAASLVACGSDNMNSTNNASRAGQSPNSPPRTPADQAAGTASTQATTPSTAKATPTASSSPTKAAGGVAAPGAKQVVDAACAAEAQKIVELAQPQSQQMRDALGYVKADVERRVSPDALCHRLDLYLMEVDATKEPEPLEIHSARMTRIAAQLEYVNAQTFEAQGDESKTEELSYEAQNLTAVLQRASNLPVSGFSGMRGG